MEESVSQSISLLVVFQQSCVAALVVVVVVVVVKIITAVTRTMQKVSRVISKKSKTRTTTRAVTFWNFDNVTNSPATTVLDGMTILSVWKWNCQSIN